MRLSFHGAAEEVTGSCFLLETERAKLLIDCGMKQGERMCVLRSLEQFGFDPRSLDAVVVTHAHFDHTGRLPELIKLGFGGPIYSTPPTKALTDIILQDSLGIMAENAERCGDPVPYEPEDKAAAMAAMQGVNYHTEFEAAPGLRVMFHDAGHILGSSFITVDVLDEINPETGNPFRLAFSGDIGNDGTPILPVTEPLHRADYVITEATYGDKLHEPGRMRKEKLRDFTKKIIGQGGTLLIPAFSVERTQELLYELDQLLQEKQIPAVPIFLDSPLAIRATAIYRHFVHYLKFKPGLINDDLDFFSFPGLRETMDKEASKAINDVRGPKIIIAGNGMMTGGRIMHHLRRYLSDKKSGLLVVGFQAPGTLGRKILDRVPKARIYGEEVDINLEVMTIDAFSAHGDKEKLTRWLHPEEGKLSKIFLVHGEEPVKKSFAEHLRNELGVDVVIPHFSQVFELGNRA